MSKQPLAALVLGTFLSSPAQALLDSTAYVVGRCGYHGYVLEVTCDMLKAERSRCQITSVYTLRGEKVHYPESLPFPDVGIRPNPLKILYCQDPPEKKKEEKKPFLCC